MKEEAIRLIDAINRQTFQVKRIADFLEEGGLPPIPKKELANLPLFNMLFKTDSEEKPKDAK